MFKNEKKFKLNFKIINYIYIICVLCIFLIYATLHPSVPIGESDDYMISTIALENHFSLDIRLDDINRVKNDFPEHYEYIKTSYEDGNIGLKTSNGTIYPWYAGTYSLACIPIKKCLKLLNLNQTYAFAITNVLIWIISLLVVVKFLNISQKQKLILLLMLTISPAILYIYWPSAEIFIYALNIITMVFFYEKKYKVAAFIVSLAGTMNLTIMPIGMIIIVDYIYMIIKKHDFNIILALKNNIKAIILLGISFFPVFIPLILNYIHFGAFNMQSTVGFSSTKDWGERVLTYLFDLNLGFLPYFIISFLLFLTLVFYGVIIKKHILTLFYFLAFIGCVSAYSLMNHINCGMSGMARYNIWVTPIFIFYLVCISGSILKENRIIITRVLLIISTLITGVYLFISAQNSYIEFTPLAKYVLNNYPSLYNPYKFTFASRTLHIDGGYGVEHKPILYSAEDGYVRKILVFEGNMESELLQCVSGSKEGINKIKNEFSKLDYWNGVAYINLGKEDKVIDIRYICESFAKETFDAYSNRASGVYENENDFCWVSSNALIRINPVFKNNLIIKYGVNSELLIQNNIQETEMKIYVNGNLMKTQIINQGGEYELKIPIENLSEEEILSINIKGKHYFIPSKSNPNSSDNRKLFITLSYIGTE